MQLIISILFFCFYFSVKAQNVLFSEQCDSLLKSYQISLPNCVYSEDTLALIRNLFKESLKHQIDDTTVLLLPEGLNCHLINCKRKKEPHFFHFAFNYKKIDFRCIKTNDFLNNALCLSNELDSLLSKTYLKDSISTAYIQKQFQPHFYLENNCQGGLRIKEEMIRTKNRSKGNDNMYLFYSKGIPSDIIINLKYSTALVIVDNDPSCQYYYYSYNSKNAKWSLSDNKYRIAKKRAIKVKTQ
ncbi:MAG: hypothetical protein JNM36_19595 [Chitinophagales bacterium]|nr:hypothetical protein [Chitinophagales bacterium]